MATIAMYNFASMILYHHDRGEMDSARHGKQI